MCAYVFLAFVVPVDKGGIFPLFSKATSLHIGSLASFSVACG